jgi:hypothetical protein
LHGVRKGQEPGLGTAVTIRAYLASSPRSGWQSECIESPHRVVLFTPLTNAFSKKIENHVHSLALFTTYYNFVKVHSKLRMSPAMAAGVSDRLWDIGDIVALVEAAETKPTKRGPDRKRVAA